MVYLYAALGVVIMTGIMAMVEMGLSLKGQSFILKPLLTSSQKESINELKQLDQNVLLLLYEKHEVHGLDPLGSPKGSPLKGSFLCAQVNASLGDPMSMSNQPLVCIFHCCTRTCFLLPQGKV